MARLESMRSANFTIDQDQIQESLSFIQFICYQLVQVNAAGLRCWSSLYGFIVWKATHRRDGLQLLQGHTFETVYRPLSALRPSRRIRTTIENRFIPTGLNKWIGRALLGTRFYNFQQLATPSLRPQTPHLLYHRRCCLLASIRVLAAFCFTCIV